MVDGKIKFKPNENLKKNKHPSKYELSSDEKTWTKNDYYKNFNDGQIENIWKDNANNSKFYNLKSGIPSILVKSIRKYADSTVMMDETQYKDDSKSFLKLFDRIIMHYNKYFSFEEVEGSNIDYAGKFGKSYTDSLYEIFHNKNEITAHKEILQAHVDYFIKSILNDSFQELLKIYEYIPKIQLTQAWKKLSAYRFVNYVKKWYDNEGWIEKFFYAMFFSRWKAL